MQQAVGPQSALVVHCDAIGIVVLDVEPGVEVEVEVEVIVSSVVDVVGSGEEADPQHTTS